MTTHALVKVFADGMDGKTLKKKLEGLSFTGMFVGDVNSHSVDIYCDSSVDSGSLINQIGRELYLDNCSFMKLPNYAVFCFSDKDMSASGGDHRRATMFQR